MTDLSDLGATSRGVWTRPVALALLTRGRVDAALRRGEWQRLWRSVYCDAGVVPDAEQRAVAAALAGPDGVAIGRTAARVWRLPLVDDDDPATGRQDGRHDDVAVPTHGRTVRCAGRVLHRRVLALDDADVLQLESGLRLTTLARTLYDLTSLVSPEALVCALDAALQRELVERAELLELAGRRRGTPQSARFARAVELADGRAESPSETLARLLLQPVLPALVPQVRVRDAAGRVVARLDLGDETRRLAVECDGRRGHAGEQMVAKDRARDATTRALGWTTERVTWFELRRRPSQLRERVVAAARRRG